MKIGYILLPIAFVMPAMAATIVFQRGTVDVKIEVEGISCRDESMMICITTLATQRAYLLKVPGNSEFVTEAYRVLLRRAPQPAYLAYYVGLLNAGTASRERIIEVLVETAEYRALP